MGAPSLGRRWRSVALPLALLRLSGQALEFAGWVVLARRLGTSTVGELAVGFLIARYVGLVADWGASFRGARDVAADGRHGSVRHYVRKRTRTSIALAALAVAVAFAVGKPGLAPLAVVVLSLGLSRDWIAMGRERGARAGIPLAAQGALVVAGSLLATTLPAAAVAVAVGYGVAAVVSILLNPLAPETPTEIDGPTTHGWILAAVLANQITSSTDTVLLSILVSTSAAGIYASIYRLPNAWLAILTLMLGSLLPMATSSHHDDHEGHLRLRNRSLRFSAMGAGLILLATPLTWFLVPVIFGTAYSSGQGPLAILMVATAVITFAAPLHPFALSSGRDRTYALVLVCGALGNIVANLLVIPLLGMNGAALTTLGAQILVAALLWRLVSSSAPSAPAPPGAPGPPIRQDVGDEWIEDRLEEPPPA